ncbi:LysR family transcriptional regulator [Pantoea rwandensis]|uniref:LysR substrate-binding domain-containing protein n=1 Tax=Pantoea rwandensis TaxID=1076550 RepID=A0A1X1D3H1_9GAMM|nr:LysR family transcriptional regulator [Pantoea rwandensis]ORM71218.1 hypothetical protein HA51_04925 [Pantoea rwandensis]
MNYLSTEYIYDLVLFIRVARKRKLVAVARSEGITIDKLRRCLKRLENRLEKDLYRIYSGDLNLTHYGHELYDRLCPLLDVFEGKFHSFERDEVNERKLVIGVVSGKHAVYPVINEFLSRYPGMSLDIVNVGIKNNASLKMTDVIIECSQQYYPQQEVTTVFKYQHNYVASAEYVFNYGIPNSVEELSDHVLIKCDYGLQSEPDVELNNGRYIYCDNLDSAYELVKSSAGIASLPEFFVTKDVDKGIVIRLIEDEKEGGMYFHATLRSRKSDKVINFMTFMTVALPFFLETKGLIGDASPYTC